MSQRRLGKFEVWIYTRNERGHRPHVHIFYGGAEVVIFIGAQAEVRENPGGMKIKDVRDRRWSSPSIAPDCSNCGGATMVKNEIAAYGEAEHRAAIARGKRTKTSPTAVLDAHYESQTNHLVVDLHNGARVTLPIKEIRELRRHSADELAEVEVSPARDGLLWRSIGVGISAPGLLTDFFGSAVHARLGAVGGSRSTPAKTLSARQNGAKGGRPRAKAS